MIALYTRRVLPFKTRSLYCYKKNYILLVLLSFLTLSVASAQVVFSNFDEARLVIGQTSFTNQNTEINNVNAPGTSAISISNNGKLAVASQSAGRVLLWNSLPAGNGQPADVVVGKQGFNDNSNNGPTASSMRNCEGVAFSPDGLKLIVSDGENNRVLIWNSLPTSNGQPADLVIGQTDFTSSVAGTAADKLRYPSGLLVTQSGKLLINDAFNHRVLIFNSIPTTNGASADVVIGQSNMTSNTSGIAANELNTPWNSAVSPDGKLLVSDSRNNRVLIYNTIPTVNNAAANLVIGQTNFNILPASGVAGNKLARPLGLAVSPKGKLAITDIENHRVLVYNSIPAINGAPADVVLGQANFTSKQEYSTNLSARTMPSPNGVQFDFNGRLFVSGKGSSLNHGRVLAFGTPAATETDLSIRSQANMALPCQEITLQYQITLQNNGPTSTSDVRVNINIPGELSLSGAPVASSGTYAGGTWALPELMLGQPVTLTITGTVSPSFSGRVIRQNAIIMASSLTDNNLNNNASGSELTVINNKPDAPVVNSVTVCTNNDTTLVATGSGTIHWYNTASATTPFFIGNSFNTPKLTATTTYYAEATLGTGCAASVRTPVTVTVNQPITNNNISGDQTVCQYTAPADFGVSTPSGGNDNYTYQWQVSGDGTNWSNFRNSTTDINFNPGGLGSTSYFRRVVSAGPCSHSISNSVKITVNPLPAVSFTGLPETACTDSPVIVLNVSPAGGKLSGPGISGNTFNPAAAGTGRHAVSYSFTNSNNCTNTTTSYILVGASVFAGNDQTVCTYEAPFQLSGFSPAGGSWSGPGVSATGQFNPAAAGPGNIELTYSVTSTFNCFSAAKTVTGTKIIRVVPLPVINPGLPLTVCIDTENFYLNGYTPTGGSWSGPGVDAIGYFRPRTAGVGKHTLTYTYYGENSCVNTASRTVTVTALPALTLAPFTSRCSSTYTSVDLTGGLPAGGTYSGNGVSSNRFIPSAAGVGTHYITYTYTDNNGCLASVSQPLQVELCTGLAEEELNANLLIFPNPTQHDLNIQLKMATPSALTIKLSNMAGRVVVQQNHKKVIGNLNETIDMTGLAKGVYLLQLLTDQGLISRRVVVE